MPYTTSHLSLAPLTFSDSLRLPRTPKFCHALRASPNESLPTFWLYLSQPHFLESTFLATSVSLLAPGQAFTLVIPHFCSHCSLHLRNSSPSAYHGNLTYLLRPCSNATFLMKCCLIPPVKMTLSSGMFTVLHWSFHFILVSCLRLPLLLCFKFLKTEILSYLGIYPLYMA